MRPKWADVPSELPVGLAAWEGLECGLDIFIDANALHCPAVQALSTDGSSTFRERRWDEKNPNI